MILSFKWSHSKKSAQSTYVLSKKRENITIFFHVKWSMYSCKDHSILDSLHDSLFKEVCGVFLLFDPHRDKTSNFVFTVCIRSLGIQRAQAKILTRLGIPLPSLVRDSPRCTYHSVKFCHTVAQCNAYELGHEKTNVLHMRKQRCRSASR